MEKRKQFLVPLMVPFNADETVNYGALKDLVKKTLNEKTDGFYVNGSSAECVLLTTAERKNILESIMENADGKYITVQVGATSTREAVELAKHAKSAGADAISTVPPHYFAYSFAEIKEYYKTLTQESGLPLMIYNIPARTNVNLSLEEWKELFEMDGIDMIKFTDTNYFLLNRIKNETSAMIYSGCDECFLSGMIAGADGAIGTSFNHILPCFYSIYEDYKAGNIDSAKKKLSDVNDLIYLICKFGCIPATKYILTLQGVAAGEARAPFGKLNAEQKDVLKKSYTELMKKF